MLQKGTRKKRKNKQLRKRHLKGMCLDSTVPENHKKDETLTPLINVSSEDSSEQSMMGGPGQINREYSLSDYLRLLHKSQSDIGLTNGLKNENCSLSDIVVEVTDETPKSPTHNGNDREHIEKNTSQDRHKSDSVPPSHVWNAPRTHSSVPCGDGSHRGKETPYLKVPHEDALNEEEYDSPKLHPNVSVSSAMRKLTGTESNPSVKKISFAEYSEGEEIKPISSDMSLHQKCSSVRFSDGDNDDRSFLSRKPSTIVEHVDSLILLESSLSLRSGDNDHSKVKDLI